MQLAFPEDDDGPESIRLTVSQPGLVITAGGSATETSYDFAAPTSSVTLDEIIATIHSHPTVTETMREAALQAEKRAIHTKN